MDSQPTPPTATLRREVLYALRTVGPASAEQVAETGYLGRAEQDDAGAIRLSEHNCAIYGVSGPYPIACQAELELLGDVLGARVTRECHIASGARSCTYLVEPAG